MKTYRFFPRCSVSLLMPSARSFSLCGALALGACFLSGTAPLFGSGEADEELVAHFDEHLNDFAKEVEGLAAHVDAIVEAHAAGREIDDSMKALIQAWEHVEMHEVIVRGSNLASI